MPAVTLAGVSKRYADGAREAVSALQLSIGDGELLVLVGPSGCGKSTVLRMIAGLEEVSGGTIRIGDRIVNDVAPRERDIAMVFQNYALYPHMSVFENLAFGLRRRRIAAEEVERRVLAAADLLGLEGYLDRRPRALSGGERQRVALGRAMVREPRVFLFDEPLSNLDARLRVQMRAEIRRMHQRVRATMIYVTHDQVEAMTLGDRIAVMREGAIQQVADPLTLYARPVNEFVASFIGSPPINLFEARIAGGGALEAGGATLAAPAVARAALASRLGSMVRVGVRPENVHVAEAGENGLEARVEMCEPLGNEVLVHWQTPAGALIARVPGQISPAQGTRATLRLPPEKLHCFDPRTGTTIGAAE
ncbi:MAG: sn-glycerol-3-phosphate ABC transporter ATP-binding protein UgpC [Candidatus Eisenbacteria bacterium]|nr:sn-glycerol-3-phosphate ABC transporter ATP-binding protein UgpC [Candidatus Eisenbacteria bacterium]